MRLENITGVAHPFGNRIDLFWKNPEPDRYPGVCIVRREGTHPTSPTDGVPVVPAFLFNLEPSFQNDLDNAIISADLKQRFLDRKVALSESAAARIEAPGSKWQILDGIRQYVVRKNGATLSVYSERSAFLFGLELSFQNDLDKGLISTGLKQEFLDNQVPLSESAAVKVKAPGSRWQILDGAQQYVVGKDGARLGVYNVGLTFAVDQNLKDETVYYYTLFPYKTVGTNNIIIIDNPAEQIDSHNRAAAMATAPYNFAGQMYELLPAIYHRYDTNLPKNPPPDMLAADKQKGQLLRFLDLMGTQLDQLYSFARAALDLHNPTRVDGNFLPLQAEWIGWKTDYRLEIEQQRNEIRSAPFTYQTIGLIPTVEATVKRISGWESRTKEFVHNVFLSNRPERLNLWARRRSAAGPWSAPTQPLSLNFAYEGRPAGAPDADGRLWLFYHTYKKRRWDIWYKTSRDGGENWEPSRPLTSRADVDKHPTAAIQGATLWVFWGAHDEAGQTWRIDFRTRSGGVWSAIQTFLDATTERRLPSAAVDDTGGLWLFWLERVGAQWQLKYNRHDGTGWQLNPAASFPLDAGADPRVEGDIYVVFHPTSANQRLWVFWARQESIATGQTRYSITYRIKQGIDPNAADWSAIRTLLKVMPDDYHDREPVALIDGSGNIELFWSSNRAGSWSIWRNILNVGAFTWGTADQITNDPYAQRAPLPLSIADDTLLIYRSNESVTYTSVVYGATQMVDFRYAGSTTVDTRNAAKIALGQKFDDFQVYTYDLGQQGERSNQDWYARDTIGLYLSPDTNDQDVIQAVISRVSLVLAEFMPITDRAVLLQE